MSKRVALPFAIKAIREAKAASEPEKFAGSKFAIRCLISHAHLCNIESDVRRPSEDLLYRIATQLGVSMAAISYVAESCEHERQAA